MKRNLTTQIKNEWRDNVWIVVGLTLVGLSIWFFASELKVSLLSYYIPVGFEEQDVYVISIANISSDAPDYIDYGDMASEMRNEDIKSLISRIRQSPNVKAAAFSQNATPYQLSYNGNTLKIVSGDKPDSIGYGINARQASPDIADVLQLKSLNGKDTKYLKEKLSEGEILLGTTSIINNRYNKSKQHSDDELLRSYVIIGNDSSKRYHVADIIENVRRSAFDKAWGGTAIFPIDESGSIFAYQIIIKVKPDCGSKFREEFDATPEMYRQRNTYLFNLTPLSDLRVSTERTNVIDVRLSILKISFMIVIIFLGLLGTFWFRMQQRVSEIAIRRVCGATSGDIFRRAIGEGLILLSIAAVFISIVGWFLIFKLHAGPLTLTDMFNCELLTLVLMAAGIISSISYPAWKAMKIEPAVAVKDE